MGGEVREKWRGKLKKKEGGGRGEEGITGFKSVQVVQREALSLTLSAKTCEALSVVETRKRSHSSVYNKTSAPWSNRHSTS